MIKLHLYFFFAITINLVFNRLNVVAVSQTWLDDEKVDDMKLDGYELFTTNGVDRTGGGWPYILILL